MKENYSNQEKTIVHAIFDLDKTFFSSFEFLRMERDPSYQQHIL